MNAAYEHPSLRLTVTTEQRDRAEAWLKDAYADGRVSEAEFDQRMGQVLGAVTRKDLNEAFYGLVTVPVPSQALGVHPAYQPIIRPEVRQQAGRGTAGFAHFSALFSWIVGPAIVFALSRPGSFTRKEAAKAFNFQLIAMIAFVVVAIVGGITGLSIFDWIMPLMWLGWLVLTIVGGAKALQGENWRNPVKQVLKLEVLSEK
ncbi:DUF1707 and DUF4870 domain-containing protein [Microlunatus ginsengisoli]|uniref:DUF1707 domain-containing protein n=1 Tax=Microlunatus ginsengisoli TaxID=363863 RepID=A0ABP6ZA33_9ACTN